MICDIVRNFLVSIAKFCWLQFLFQQELKNFFVGIELPKDCGSHRGGVFTDPPANIEQLKQRMRDYIRNIVHPLRYMSTWLC